MELHQPRNGPIIFYAGKDMLFANELRKYTLKAETQ